MTSEADNIGMDNIGMDNIGMDNSGMDNSGTGNSGMGNSGRTLEPGSRAERPRALTLAWVEGTYLSTTTAITRQERLAAAGLDVRARANMVVDDSTVRWERDGLGEVRVAGSQLLGVSQARRLAHMLRGHAHIVLVSWRAGHGTPGTTGERYVTSFLPRARADSAVLVSAVQRLMTISAGGDAHTTPDGNP